MRNELTKDRKIINLNRQRVLDRPNHLYFASPSILNATETSVVGQVENVVEPDLRKFA